MQTGLREKMETRPPCAQTGGGNGCAVELHGEAERLENVARYPICLAVSRCGREAPGCPPGRDWCARPPALLHLVLLLPPQQRKNCERRKTREEEKGTAPLNREKEECGGGLTGRVYFLQRTGVLLQSGLDLGVPASLSVQKRLRQLSITETPRAHLQELIQRAVASRRKTLGGSGASESPAPQTGQPLCREPPKTTQDTSPEL